MDKVVLQDAIVRAFFFLAMYKTMLSPKATEGLIIANEESGLALAQPLEVLAGTRGYINAS